MGISLYRLAVELHVSPPRVNDIVREKRGISPQMATRLTKYFGASEQFWLNSQDSFAVIRSGAIQQGAQGHPVPRQRQPLARGSGKAHMIPVDYMAKHVNQRSERTKAPQLSDVFFATPCVSEDFADYIPFWKRGG
ncbi:MAG TPA: HigA family addiction module antitoxin [Candidatus Polarisedimenticolia bacterium]|nr:HigA family addiction module antitoxin [Candidatus Polarisedimenticolia bacterium]